MSYGFKTWNGNGLVGIDSTEVAVRYVATVLFERTFSGTISVPDFDSNRGSFYLNPYTYKWNLSNNTLVAESTNTATGIIEVEHSYRADGGLRTNPRPTLSWNNSTKLLSVTNNGTYSPWRVLFLHHK